eukprot:scaffold16669_cov35-Attheya_sp.AAC.1
MFAVLLQVEDVVIKVADTKDEDVVLDINTMAIMMPTITTAGMLLLMIHAAINDPCRYHGNAHTWKMCYGNPDGPNYRPGFQPRPQGNTGRGRGNGGRFQPV